MTSPSCFVQRYWPGIAHLITPRGLVPGIDKSTPIEQVPVISIDCESTDRDPNVARILEIAAADESGVRISALVNPGVPIPADATAVNRITYEMVATAPSWGEVRSSLSWPTLVPLAYNQQYDRTLIRNECMRHNVPMPFGDCEYDSVRSIAWIDPLVWARSFYAGAKSRSLGAMCELLGIQFSEAHRAANDATAALKVWQALRSDPRMPRTYGQVIMMQRSLAKEQAETRKWA